MIFLDKADNFKYNLGRKDLIMLGKNIYFLKFDKTEGGAVKDGFCVGEYISDNGYRTMLIMCADGRISREAAYVFESRTEAENALAIMQPTVDKMQSLDERTTNKLNEMRKELIGEPEFPEFKNMKGKK